MACGKGHRKHLLKLGDSLLLFLEGRAPRILNRGLHSGGLCLQRLQLPCGRHQVSLVCADVSRKPLDGCGILVSNLQQKRITFMLFFCTIPAAIEMSASLQYKKKLIHAI